MFQSQFIAILSPKASLFVSIAWTLLNSGAPKSFCSCVTAKASSEQLRLVVAVQPRQPAQLPAQPHHRLHPPIPPVAGRIVCKRCPHAAGCALIGYYVAAFTVDSKYVGRIRIQLLGFAMVGILFFVSAIWYKELIKPGGIHVFQFIYFFSSFWGQWGPNCTTFLLAGARPVSCSCRCGTRLLSWCKQLPCLWLTAPRTWLMYALQLLCLQHCRTRTAPS